MKAKSVKVLGLLALSFVSIGFLMQNIPAYANNGYGTHTAPQFGSGPWITYTAGLTIDFTPFDISNHTQTIKTQTIFVGYPTDIKLKIFHQATPQYIQHVIVNLNVRGTDPQPSQSDTWLEWDKQDGFTVHDPGKFFKNVSVTTTYDSQFMYLTFHINAQKPIGTTDMIITSWDKQLSTSVANVLDAFKIKYLPFQFS